MRRLLGVATAALVLAVSGCSGSPSAGGTPSPAESESSAIASASTPTAAPSSAAPVVSCLNARYRLVRFVGVGEKGTFGTGEGGDVTVTFNNGSYLLRGAGKNPIKLTLAGQTADLLVDGKINGDYRVEGDKIVAIGMTAGRLVVMLRMLDHPAALLDGGLADNIGARALLQGIGTFDRPAKFVL